MLNQSMMTNRRCSAALEAEKEIERVVHAATLLPAAVAYFNRCGKIPTGLPKS
jgi:hypothetical protein